MDIKKVDELFNRHGIDIFSDTLTKHEGFDTIMHKTINEVIELCADACEKQEQRDCEGELNIYRECAKAIRAI